MVGAARSEEGQSTVEWVGLVLLVALAVGALGAVAGAALPGTGLARVVASRLLCATALGESCASLEGSKLELAYGAELAALVAEHAPNLIYEEGMEALPVDYRSCREDPCSMGAPAGEVLASRSGEPVTLFTRAVDCRAPGSAAGADCSGRRAGNLYLQYWAYYPGSRTRVWGDRGFHPDDWESLQVRVGADGGADARASSHNGYNYGDDVRNWITDTGVATKAGWGPSEDLYFIAGGSHAGKATDPGRLHRWTPDSAIRLVPLEPIAGRGPGARFEITPPWEKRVWTDPEYEGTD